MLRNARYTHIEWVKDQQPIQISTVIRTLRKVVASCHFFLELTPNHDRNMEVPKNEKQYLRN